MVLPSLDLAIHVRTCITSTVCRRGPPFDEMTPRTTSPIGMPTDNLRVSDLPMSVVIFALPSQVTLQLACKRGREGGARILTVVPW